MGREEGLGEVWRGRGEGRRGGVWVGEVKWETGGGIGQKEGLVGGAEGWEDTGGRVERVGVGRRRSDGVGGE